MLLYIGSCIRAVQNLWHINLCLTAACRIFLLIQQITSADQFIDCMNSQLCHIFPHFLRHKLHEVYNIFRLAFKAFPQFRILCCNTNRTSIQVADTHHYTSHGNQRSRCKTEFFCTQHSCNHNIPPGHHLSVCFNNNFRTQVIHDQSVVGFRKSQFPR